MNDLVAFGLAALVAGLVTLAGWGVHEVAMRASLPRGLRRRISVGVVAIIAAWLGVTALLARTGVLAVWTSRPPRLLLLPLTVFATLMFVNRTNTFRALLERLPRWWPVALQTFRVGVELVLWGLYVTHQVPVQITFEGRNFDVLIGASAPFVAYLVASNRIAPWALLAWHALGFAMLANVIGIVVTSLPGPLHLDWPGEPLTAIASWPAVWIPAFLAPLAVFLHIVSIRQNVASLRAGAAERSPR